MSSLKPPLCERGANNYQHDITFMSGEKFSFSFSVNLVLGLFSSHSLYMFSVAQTVFTGLLLVSRNFVWVLLYTNCCFNLHFLFLVWQCFCKAGCTISAFLFTFVAIERLYLADSFGLCRL